MRILSNPDNDTLKTLPDAQKAFNHCFITSQIKNLFPALNSPIALKTQQQSYTASNFDENAMVEEEEDLKKESLLALSKKIQKLNASRSSKILNKTKSIQQKNKFSSIPPKVFLEEKIIQKTTSNYDTVFFIRRHDSTPDSDETIENFICFDEKELNIPQEYAQKTVVNAFDNDVQTDDEQIEVAIKDLFESLQEKIKEENRITEKYAKAFKFFNES